MDVLRVALGYLHEKGVPLTHQPPARDELTLRRPTRFLIPHKCAGLLAWALGRGVVNDGDRAIAEVALRTNDLACLKRVGVAVSVHREMATAGIPCISIKGAALAQQAWGSFSARGPGDVDVVVPPERLDDAVSVLTASGAHVRGGQMAQGRRGLHPIVHAVTLSMQGVDVDVHSRLDPMEHVCEISMQDLVSEQAVVTMAGVEIPTVGLVHAALLATSHAARDSWSRMGHVLDFALLHHQVIAVGRIDELHERADEFNVGPRLALALAVLRRVDSRVPKQSMAAEALARQVWLRLASGRDARVSQAPREVLYLNTMRVATAPSWKTLAWSAKRATDLPSSSIEQPLGERPDWVYALSSPYLVVRRLISSGAGP